MLNLALHAAFAMLTIALALNVWRTVRGPSAPDRILGLDTLYINSIALLMITGIAYRTPLYFEAALLIAMVGFVGTVALCKYVLRGDIIE